MRIVTGAIVHETSTFTPVPTTRESFTERFGPLRGAEIFERFRNTNIPTSGFMDGAEKHGFELIPTLYLSAYPSGPIARDAFEQMLSEMLELMEAAKPFDGVLLELHGSMVAQGIDDADGYILEAVRKLVGPDIPIVAQLDIHSTITQQMVEMADVLIGRETYPEVDMAERGRECADVLMRILRDGVRPTMALHQIPMIWGMNQTTSQQPMREAIERLHALEAVPGVVCASISTGFWLVDAPDMGASVFVVTDNDLPLAQRLADELGEWLYERRAQWHYELPNTREAIRQVQATNAFPAIFADLHDNPGGGSGGDSAGVLRAFLELKLEDACFIHIVDPQAVQECFAAGEGATITLDVGGKTSPLQGAPVRMQAEVVKLSDGTFRHDGPMYHGLLNSYGPTAYIRQGGVHVLLVSKRSQAFDMALARTVGLEPTKMRYIGVKSAGHFRAAFEPWAGSVTLVAEPSVHHPEGGKLAYKRLKRKLYPIDILE
jgi:microcystin degradation protein MlrC